MKKKILIIEDVNSWRELYDELLTLEYSLQFANNFQEAIIFLDKETYDLVILDLSLDLENIKNVDGLILLSIIRKKESKLPTVVVSGYSDMFKLQYYKKLKPTLQFNKMTFNTKTFQEGINKLLNNN